MWLVRNKTELSRASEDVCHAAIIVLHIVTTLVVFDHIDESNLDWCCTEGECGFNGRFTTVNVKPHPYKYTWSIAKGITAKCSGPSMMVKCLNLGLNWTVSCSSECFCTKSYQSLTRLSTWLQVSHSLSMLQWSYGDSRSCEEFDHKFSDWLSN